MKNVGTARASPNPPEKPNTGTVPREAPGLTAHPWGYFLSNSKLSTQNKGRTGISASLNEETRSTADLEECGTQTNLGSFTFMILFLFQSIK